MLKFLIKNIQILDAPGFLFKKQRNCWINYKLGIVIITSRLKIISEIQPGQNTKKEKKDR